MCLSSTDFHHHLSVLYENNKEIEEQNNYHPIIYLTERTNEWMNEWWKWIIIRKSRSRWFFPLLSHLDKYMVQTESCFSIAEY